ncbi:MAG: tRNA lysidine(34) synthetase TilS [Desulfobaccales bacterium]|nr:tRNA lysidine(34) synthetase TilS [Desulfobaccales bacterium]
MPHPGGLSQPLLDHTVSAKALLQWVLAYARRQELFTPQDRVLVAVSGGPDSVALLHLLYRLKDELDLDLAVGHFDHGLRGRESEEDARFVADLARSLALPFHLGQGEVRGLAQAAKISLQMAGRQLRLNFLKETCRGHSYRKLALGHTADDQVELFFLRLLRGAGAEGLKGMWPSTPEGLVRPLLAVGKAVLVNWLEQESLPYRQDSSNLSRGYLRNRVRLDLLPQLRRHYNPRLTEAIWRTQALLKEDERLLAAQTAHAWAAVGQTKAPDFFSLDLPRLFTLDPGLQKRLLRATLGKLLDHQEITAAQVASLLALAQGEKSGGLISLGEAQVARAGPELHIFRRLPVPPGRTATLLPSPSERVDSPEGWRWQITSRPHDPQKLRPDAPHFAWLDQDRLTFPLEVRYFRPGDRFWPLGSPGPKKLQDFLVDSKIPRWLRPYLPLITSAGRIVWVVGLRVAEPVKLTPSSRTVLEINATPNHATTRRLWEILQKVGGKEI